MNARCEKCVLPKIVEALRANKAGAQAALANVLSAESPTEQARYQQIADALTEDLRTALKQHKDFFDTFGSTCEGCSFNRG